MHGCKYNNAKTTINKLMCLVCIKSIWFFKISSRYIKYSLEEKNHKELSSENKEKEITFFVIPKTTIFLLHQPVFENEKKKKIPIVFLREGEKN